MESSKKGIRLAVVLPPCILIAALVILNFVNYELFETTVTSAVSSILDRFAWFLNLAALGSLILTVITYLSPIANVKIGGEDARPVLKYRNYIWIVLCTIMGAGLMLWACSEPIIHIHSPAAQVSGGPMSGESVLWAMENIFLEWTFTPMAIYTIPTLLFGFMVYNRHKGFSVASMLSPLLADEKVEKCKKWIDMICIFSIALGMACTLGSGITILSEGISTVSSGSINGSPLLYMIIGAVLIVCYTASAISGVSKSIKTLSTINSYFYLVLGVLVFALGPAKYILNLGTEAFGAYLADFFKLSLWTSTSTGDGWSHWWAQFYWCTWFAWMPISAVFLGKISKGYTVRQVLNAVFLYPSLFSVLWLSIFSCASIFFDLKDGSLFAALSSSGMGATAYVLIGKLPLAFIISILFILTAFLSYVTAADSNTNAIASLSTVGLTEEDTESPAYMKIFWGVLVGLLCMVMLLAFGMDGMKMLADFGGFPAAFLMIAFLAAWGKVLLEHRKTNR